ncbi:hypothetical protein KGF57_002350 [Candida theae]|uniref:Uncharacterized protein n=1 Tax=Candida theae TaxID=1198502 RepID=A0AAD5BFU7_9ASCO|nr:uncharacterized protein KGF57_002350 [Candida theae]KAI5958916.1 hypothetical protein KGF57_002350 [Candida theae]
MSKVITTKSTVQNEQDDDRYTKTVIFLDESEKEVFIPFPLETTSTSRSLNDKLRHTTPPPQTPIKWPLQSLPTTSTPRQDSAKERKSISPVQKNAQDSNASDSSPSNHISACTKDTSAASSPEPTESDETFRNATMSQLGQEMVKLLHDTGFVSAESTMTNPRKRRRDDEDAEEFKYPESRTYNCELEFDITTDNKPYKDKNDKNDEDDEDDEDDNDDDGDGSREEEEESIEITNASKFTVSLQLIYVFKPEIDLTSIPINLYITKSELIKHLMDKLVLRHSEDPGTDLYSVESKIKKLLNLKRVRCWINGYELDL